MAGLWTSILNLVHIFISCLFESLLYYFVAFVPKNSKWCHPFNLSTKILYVFHHPCSWYLSAHHLDWSLIEYLVKSTNYQASCYAVLFVSFHPLCPIILSVLFSQFCSFFIQCGTAFHTYKIKDTHGNIKVSKMNGGKHLWKLICCYFLCECKFDFLLLFPSIWTSSLFKGSIKYLYVTIFSCIFMTGHEHTSTHLCAYSFSAFRPAFLHHMPAMSWVLQAKLQMWEI